MANNPTASKQYVLPISFTAGDITTGTLAGDIGLGGTINYLRVGNLIFGIWIDTGGPDNDIVEGGGITSASRIASLLGTTPNTIYTTTGRYIGLGGSQGWNGATWLGVNPPTGNVLMAILLN